MLEEVVNIMKIKPLESQNPFSKQTQYLLILPYNTLWKIYVKSLLSQLDQNRHEMKTSTIKMHHVMSM